MGVGPASHLMILGDFMVMNLHVLGEVRNHVVMCLVDSADKLCDCIELLQGRCGDECLHAYVVYVKH